MLQTEEMAVNKSKSWKALLKHTYTYAIVWVFASCILFGWVAPTHTANWYVIMSLIFGYTTFILHTITDYITSRITSKLFADKIYYRPFPRMGAFAVIGFDQVLHYAQLFLTFHILSTWN
jgi:hypothetical protein